MKIIKFEDILSWQKANKLALNTYSIFNLNKDYWFRDQIQRCCVSISNNIAEGFERKSNNEFKRFLYIAKWSCWEFRSMLYLAKDLEYLNNKQFSTFYNEAIEISKLLWWLIKSIN